MKPDTHERSRRLSAESRVVPLDRRDAAWLAAHLEECDMCRAESESLGRAISSIRSLPSIAPAGLAARTIEAVRQRSHQMQEERSRTTVTWIAAVFCVVTTLALMPLTWSFFRWIEQMAPVSEPVLRGAVVIWWFFPAIFAAIVLAWLNARDHQPIHADIDWRQS